LTSIPADLDCLLRPNFTVNAAGVAYWSLNLTCDANPLHAVVLHDIVL